MASQSQPPPMLTVPAPPPGYAYAYVPLVQSQQLQHQKQQQQPPPPPALPQTPPPPYQLAYNTPYYQWQVQQMQQGQQLQQTQALQGEGQQAVLARLTKVNVELQQEKEKWRDTVACVRCLLENTKQTLEADPAANDVALELCAELERLFVPYFDSRDSKQPPQLQQLPEPAAAPDASALTAKLEAAAVVRQAALAAAAQARVAKNDATVSDFANLQQQPPPTRPVSARESPSQQRTENKSPAPPQTQLQGPPLPPPQQPQQEPKETTETMAEDDGERMTCQLCLEDLPLSAFSALRCSHMYCAQCLQEYFRGCISSRKLPIICPDPDCKQEVALDDIAQLCPHDLVERMHGSLLELAIESHPESFSCCPTPDCGYVFIWEPGDPVDFLCPKCGKRYCLQCKSDYHEGVSCEMNRKMKKGENNDDDLFADFVKGSKFKQCRKCKNWVELATGCNHVKCRCGHEFCYACGGDYPCKCGQDPHAPGFRPNNLSAAVYAPFAAFQAIRNYLQAPPPPPQRRQPQQPQTFDQRQFDQRQYVQQQQQRQLLQQQVLYQQQQFAAMRQQQLAAAAAASASQGQFVRQAPPSLYRAPSYPPPQPQHH
eukprot:TRINITY_DN205_c0_g1_i2.p1 TRINITY_DN205_c0_g1~~TRINITY_DN205_c0_g1_i2.p1  ORF type:complete len:628 (+),score=189.68 TRINITY_DN205_c0_g1_i2:87-1886(+)